MAQSGAERESTLAEDLAERIRVEGKNILIIEPVRPGHGAHGQAGQGDGGSLQVADAIAEALDPHASLKASPVSALHKSARC